MDDAPQLSAGSAGMLRVQDVLGRMRGARLCYGKAVQAGSRTIIPVAKIFVAGGGGFGQGSGSPQANPEAGEGGGGGGTLSAAPVGFIEVGEDGARFRRIGAPPGVLQLLALITGSAVATAFVLRRLKS